jgi:hypothetical protein
MNGKVNKGMPVFLGEKGCIRKLPILIRPAKYSVSHRKIQGLPYILCTGLLYDGIKRTFEAVEAAIRFEEGGGTFFP